MNDIKQAEEYSVKYVLLLPFFFFSGKDQKIQISHVFPCRMFWGTVVCHFEIRCKIQQCLSNQYISISGWDAELYMKTHVHGIGWIQPYMQEVRSVKNPIPCLTRSKWLSMLRKRKTKKTPKQFKTGRIWYIWDEK